MGASPAVICVRVVKVIMQAALRLVASEHYLRQELAHHGRHLALGVGRLAQGSRAALLLQLLQRIDRREAGLENDHSCQVRWLLRGTGLRLRAPPGLCAAAGLSLAQCCLLAPSTC